MRGPIGAAALTLACAGPLAAQSGPWLRTGVALDRPAGVTSTATSWWRLGVGEFGRGVAVAGGVAGVVSVPGQDLSLGGFAAARIALGRFELSGEVGQLVSVAGTPGNQGGGLGADTGVRIGRGVRSLLHGQLEGTFRRDWIHLGARVLRRTRLTPYDGLGWEASAGIEVAAGAVVRLTVGRAPIGPSVYLPFRRAATIGFELVPRRPRSAVALAPAADRSGLLAAAFDWTVQPSTDLVGFRVRMPGAASVELAGDFTDWQPVALTFTGNGYWEVALPVPSGLRLLSIRVDGGPFLAPPGLETADDGFGGRAGVVFIDRPAGPG